uniref:hypothetical protein n=1 Tax=Pectobacterium carotovorum TaxID=554 RepID=UPI0015E81C23|nr:hypothetical protein [Pectobacterium carotovorum]
MLPGVQELLFLQAMRVPAMAKMGRAGHPLPDPDIRERKQQQLISKKAVNFEP